jgi:hypothetical protein
LKYAKIDKAYSLKRCIDLLGTTFVLRLLKILSAPSRTSASNIEKMVKKFKNLQFFKIFSKILAQIGHNIACSTRLVNAFMEKITMIYLLKTVLRKKRGQKRPLLTIFFSHEKTSPITKMSISYLLEWLGDSIFEMMKNLNHEIH